MKYRVEFKKPTENVTYFKDMTAHSAIDAQMQVHKKHPEARIDLIYPIGSSEMPVQEKLGSFGT